MVDLCISSPETAIHAEEIERATWNLARQAATGSFQRLRDLLFAKQSLALPVPNQTQFELAFERSVEGALMDNSAD